MPEKNITIRLNGSPGDNEDVRLDDFIEQLNTVKKALRENERIISGSDQPKIDYKIVGLSRNSPSRVVLQPVPLNGNLPDYTEDVIGNFSDELRLIRNKGKLNAEPELDRLQAYRELGGHKDNRISSIKISVGRKTTEIDHIFQAKLEKIFGPDDIIGGSVSGMLDAVNFHNTNKFTLYPILGARKIAGKFPSELRPKIKAAIGSHVTLVGQLRYKQWSPYPHAITAEDIEIHPPDNELPTLTDLKGSFAGITDGISSLVFVEKIRNESW
jgi:hypothetical protein